MTDENTKFETEMNRGFLQILVLVVLEQEMYGYMILKFLDDSGYAVEESTLYPLLRRLEKYGLVKSRWAVENDRPRKFYKITTSGKSIKIKLLKKWQHQNKIISDLIKKKEV
jgi:DNA-binding PadR family transcriptional regulator